MTRNDLIEKIAGDLDIAPGVREQAEAWAGRVIYSAAGLNMLAAAYDYDDSADDAGTVSMQHVGKRGKTLLKILGMGSGVDVNGHCFGKRVVYMRKLYRDTGYLLHRARRLTYAPDCCAKIGDFYITRGQPPWGGVSGETHVSGLASFSSKGVSSVSDLEDMFHIDRMGGKTILEWYDAFIQSAGWQPCGSFPDNVEYANINDGSTRDYWIDRHPKSGISVFREKRQGEPRYSLLKITDRLEFCDLQDWQIKRKEYWRIIAALKIESGSAPSLTIRQDGPVFELRLGYLLPLAEQNLFELCSWPVSENKPWHRICSMSALPLVEKICVRLDYNIQKE
jgi:hypothetical protein